MRTLLIFLIALIGDGIFRHFGIEGDIPSSTGVFFLVWFAVIAMTQDLLEVVKGLKSISKN